MSCSIVVATFPYHETMDFATIIHDPRSTASCSLALYAGIVESRHAQKGGWSVLYHFDRLAGSNAYRASPKAVAFDF